VFCTAGVAANYSLCDVEVYTGPNLALGKPATAGAIQGPGYEPGRAFDGDSATRWSSPGTPSWDYVDLGATFDVRAVRLNWEAAFASSYKVQVSSDANTWSDIYSTTSGRGGVENLTRLSGQGRYLRVYCTASIVNGGAGYSLWEVEVYGLSSLAAGKSAVASAIQGPGYEASKAFDTNTATRWSGGSDSQHVAWVYADLGATYDVRSVRLNWEAAFGSTYKVQISDDASTWSDIYSTSNGDGGTDLLTGLSGRGRYLRVYCTYSVVNGGAGYSLWEVAAFTA
jgi:hypothetical protein